MSEFSLLSRNFILACLSGFLYFGSVYLLLPTMPQFVADLGGTTSQIGIVVGVFTIASVILRPYFGKLADGYGRKTIMLVGSGLVSLLFVPYFQMQNIIPLCVLRFFHGIAHGCYLAAAFAYVADLAPLNRRGEVMGVYGVANVVAMALFPAWGNMIITTTHDFSRLFLCSVISAGIAFLAVCFIDEIKIKGNKKQMVSIWAVGRQKSVLVASLTFFAAATFYGSIITFIPAYAPKQGITNFGVFFTTYALFTLISRVFSGKISDQYGRRKVILPFLILLAIAAFLLPFLESIEMLMIIAACFGFGFGALMPALNAFVVDQTLPHERASALAFFTSFMDVGITAGAIVLGIVGEYWGYGIMYAVCGVITCLGFALFAIGSKDSQANNAVQG